jgi:predicted RNA methylase
MYTLPEYGKMLADRVRMDAYLECLRRTVFPGCTVVDLGAGPGVFSLYACRWGAGRVYAIEPGESIQLVRELAIANGYSDRLIAVEDYSSNFDIPERADIIITDLRGVLPFFRASIATVADARDRLLKPGGVLIPQRDILSAAVITAPDVYRRQVEAWDQPGFDMRPARIRSVNTISKIYPKLDDLITEPVELGRIDYMTAANARFTANPTWEIKRSGVTHGVVVWFDTTLIEGVSFSNAPDQPETIYGAAFLPFVEPQRLESGDRVSCQLNIDPLDDDYLWRWEATFERRSGIRQAKFSQSTFHATLIHPEV